MEKGRSIAVPISFTFRTPIAAVEHDTLASCARSGELKPFSDLGHVSCAHSLTRFCWGERPWMMLLLEAVFACYQVLLGGYGKVAADGHTERNLGRSCLNRNFWEDFIMSANPNPCTTSMTLLVAGLTAGMITVAAAGSLGGPLELQDEGVFFVNGQAAATAFPDSPPSGAAAPGQIMIDQMYVQYRIPKNVSAPPIVMVHGSGHTGVTYETT